MCASASVHGVRLNANLQWHRGVGLQIRDSLMFNFSNEVGLYASRTKLVEVDPPLIAAVVVTVAVLYLFFNSYFPILGYSYFEVFLLLGSYFQVFPFLGVFIFRCS